jgi:hypothetical protein
MHLEIGENLQLVYTMREKKPEETGIAPKDLI